MRTHEIRLWVGLIGSAAALLAMGSLVGGIAPAASAGQASAGQASAGQASTGQANAQARDPCPRPAPGGAVEAPRDLRSRNGVLSVDLTFHGVREPDGSWRYCYLAPDGTQSPTLRLQPGDLLILRLKNALPDGDAINAANGADTAGAAKTVVAPPRENLSANPMSPVKPRIVPAMCKAGPQGKADPCSGGAMLASSTNLHFHGLTVPPLCHQDDVLKTSIQATDPPFEYRFRVPRDEAPGLYWYHPHIHGFSSKQVLGGASGALIIEGLERAAPEVAGLPERVLVIRDQDLLNPAAPPAKSEPVVPRMLIDRDGDSANNGTGFGRPAKDLSVNFIPVPYPDYPPASIVMRPGEQELWRVLNASAITYLNLAVLFQRAPQSLGIVAIDGVPAHREGGSSAITWVNHIGVPPGARVEFIVKGPPAGTPGLLVTRTVDTGQGGENDPNRALAALHASPDAAAPASTMPSAQAPPPVRTLPWLGGVAPVRVRKLYFSEKLEDPRNPNSATTFYLTVDGATPAPFDPRSEVPNIVVKQGDVEDWIIENRSTELHAFHIHQLHFKVIDWSGLAVDEPFLRDTVNVPFYNGRTLQYPSVRLRMDFRDPDTVGTFVYHCHLLEHEDGGMMGTVRVDPVAAR